MSRETSRSAIRKDTVAGFVNAVVSVPEGLASATLAGVNPVYGIYTSIAAPITGSAHTPATSQRKAGAVHPDGHCQFQLVVASAMSAGHPKVRELSKARLSRLVQSACLRPFYRGVCFKSARS
jgi:MFS superfamily sulfate permease-like transporter